LEYLPNVIIEDVEIQLAGSLARYASGGATSVWVAPGRRLLDVAAEIGIPPRQALLALANETTVDLNYVLAPGDRIRLVPPIAGG
jgi:molybdopterin converting factor small subunit